MKTLMIILSLLVAQFAAAQQCTKLLYVGAPLTNVQAQGGSPAAITGPLTGTVTLAQPLPANAVNFTPEITSWDFSSEYSDLNFDAIGQAPWYGAEAPTFSFTVIDGTVTAWSSGLTYYLGPGTENTYNIYISSTPQGDSITVDSNFPSSSTGHNTITGTSNLPGTWSCVTSFTDNFVASPIAPVAVAVNPLAAQVTTLTSKVTALTAQTASLTKQVSTLTTQAAQVAPLTAKSTALTTQVAAMTKQISALTTQAAQVAPLTTKVSTLTTQLTSMTKTSASWNVQYVAAEKALVAANATIAKLTAQLNTQKTARLGR